MAEIVVIGAGIAGLATAGALQRRGHSVTVIEERTDTGSGAGISIWPNALAALDALGLGDRVRFLGNRDDVPTLLAATDLTVLTSDWEGLPMAILESMAVGVPLVASDVDGLREVLGKGGGTLVEPGDHEAFATAIAHALSSERWREEQSAAALRRIREDYSPAAMMTRYDTEIRGMIRARGSLRCRK